MTVVIGNPPYGDKAEGQGAWIEKGSEATSGDKVAKIGRIAPLDAFRLPGNGLTEYVLKNLYVYFWRWATWQVFDHEKGKQSGVVCYITVSGFLNGPGFQRMREYMRRTCDDIWVIDCSPAGHQPEVNTRIFQGVQQPVCIVAKLTAIADQIESAMGQRFCTARGAATCTSALEMAAWAWGTR